MNTHRICTPVSGKSRNEFYTNLEAIQNISSFIEVRLDTLSEISLEMVEEIKGKIRVPCIATCRSAEEGGSFTGKEHTRLAILQKAVDLGFDYVDIELSACEEHQLQRTSLSKIIISYHNFLKTPDYWDLTKIVDDMHSYRPDIVKIATMVLQPDDVRALYRLIISKKTTDEVIAIGMGNDGRITRIVTPLIGGYLTYAATKYCSSAPGQIMLEELQQVYATISSLS